MCALEHSWVLQDVLPLSPFADLLLPRHITSWHTLKRNMSFDINRGILGSKKTYKYKGIDSELSTAWKLFWTEKHLSEWDITLWRIAWRKTVCFSTIKGTLSWQPTQMGQSDLFTQTPCQCVVLLTMSLVLENGSLSDVCILADILFPTRKDGYQVHLLLDWIPLHIKNTGIVVIQNSLLEIMSSKIFPILN